MQLEPYRLCTGRDGSFRGTGSWHDHESRETPLGPNLRPVSKWTKSLIENRVLNNSSLSLSLKREKKPSSESHKNLRMRGQFYRARKTSHARYPRQAPTRNTLGIDGVSRPSPPPSQLMAKKGHFSGYTTIVLTWDSWREERRWNPCPVGRWVRSVLD